MEHIVDRTGVRTRSAAAALALPPVNHSPATAGHRAIRDRDHRILVVRGGGPLRSAAPAS
jgi:hypothetical protein